MADLPICDSHPTYLLNILVFFYWLDGIISRGHPDMGIAVILLTIVIRILLLPLDLAGDKSEADRHQMILRLHEIETTFAADPIAAILQVLREQTRRRSTLQILGELHTAPWPVSSACSSRG